MKRLSVSLTDRSVDLAEKPASSPTALAQRLWGFNISPGLAQSLRLIGGHAIAAPRASMRCSGEISLGMAPSIEVNP